MDWGQIRVIGCGVKGKGEEGGMGQREDEEGGMEEWKEKR